MGGGGGTGAATRVPGFVDLQVNGYRGVSFSDVCLSRDSCASACAAVLAEGGCSAFMPTVITASLETYEHVLPLIADVIEAEAAREGAAQLGPCVGRLLGIHMEGPFISAQPGAVGAHPPQHVLTPAHCPEGGRALLRRWRELSRGHLQLITVAAEVEGAPELIECAPPPPEPALRCLAVAPAPQPSSHGEGRRVLCPLLLRLPGARLPPYAPR